MIKQASEKDKKAFNLVARHPLQSWEWGEFREHTGVEVTRILCLVDGKVRESYQVTWHKVPKTPFVIGYCPKSAIPNKEALDWLATEAKRRRAIFLKFEPNESEGVAVPNTLVPGDPLFTKYSFVLDISIPEEKILVQMNQKTRYNIRLAMKKGVEVVEDKSEEGFEDYWRLTEETTRRQNFYAHTKNYHKKMWEMMVSRGKGRLLKAVYQNKVLATWILFSLNGVLYYPYGASSSENREVMASNLMMWEAIRLGKKMGCKKFDLWGSLGEEPDKTDKWYGFHKFKEGYGGKLVEFVGSYDMVLNPVLYKIYKAANWFRWKVLRKWRT